MFLPFRSRASKAGSATGEPIIPHIALENREIVDEVDLLQAGPWGYMAGARIVPGGLEFSLAGLDFVNKREDNRIESDPPLNLYGPRLQVEGDFAVIVHIQSKTPVALQLYGQVPLRFDDFRYERSRLECLASENKLSVRIWNGSKQEPTVVRDFQFENSPIDWQIEVRREGSELVFAINSKHLGSLPEGGIFRAGEVWLGLNSEQGRARVSSLVARPLNGYRVESINTASLRVAQPSVGGLQTLVHKPGFHIGAAIALNPLVSDVCYAQVFLGGELGSVTIENALKPQNVQPMEGVFTFGEAVALIELAERHGLAVHGHTLAYDKAMPRWMHELPYKTDRDRQRVRDVLERHVQTVVGHFKGRIASWDVVNEAIAGINVSAHLQDSVWFKALGEEYIDVAFHAAHEADPQAELYINDYGLETNPRGRGQFMIDLAKILQVRGVPIHGVGIQGHVYQMPRDTIKPKILRRLMDDIGALGLKVRISELDVTGARGSEIQAQQYADVLRVCLEAPNCTGLTIWGLDDQYGSTAELRDGQLRSGNALPYTTDYHPKPARQALRDTLLTSRHN